MKRFLIGILAVIAVCCGVAALSACSETPAAYDGKYSGYGEDIEYRLAVTSEEECPAGNITEDKLHADCKLEKGKTYYIVLDLTFKNFNWAGERYSVAAYLSNTSEFSCTLHEAFTADFDEEEDGDFYIVTTRYNVPRDRAAEKTDRVVYEIEMSETAGRGAYGCTGGFAVNFEVDGLGKSPTYSVGYDMRFEMNADNASYAVAGGIDMDDYRKVGAGWEIPAHYGTYPVTSIGADVFAYFQGSLTIPATITHISATAFNNGKTVMLPDINNLYLTDIEAWCNIDFENFYSNPMLMADNFYLNGEPMNVLDIPQGVKEIKKCAFAGFHGTAVNIPSSVTSIGENAFYGCQFTELTIPASVTYIGRFAFDTNRDLKTVNIADMAAWCNIEFEDKTAVPLRNSGAEIHFDGAPVTALTLPQEVTQIKAYAFYGCKTLTSVEIAAGSRLNAVGAHAFGECENLEGVHVADMAAWCNIDFEDKTANPLSSAHALYLNDVHVTDLSALPADSTAIKKYSFCGADFENLTIPDSITSIGECAFDGCGFAELTIPESVTQSEGAFGGCSAETVRIPASLIFDIMDVNMHVDTVIITSGDAIPERAFSNSYIIKNIHIPASVTSIGNSAFYGCKSLVSVEFGEGSNLSSIGNWAFQKCTALESITIPASVTEIGGSAFDGCSRLTSVRFENTAGWHAAFTFTDVDVGDPSRAARYLTDDYSGYTWTRDE